VAGAHGKGSGSSFTGVSELTTTLTMRPRPFPASARERRRVSETSESAGPKRRPGSRSSRREAGEGHEPELMAKLLTSTLRLKTPAQPTNRKSSVPESEEDAIGIDLTDGQRDSFRRLYVCLLDDGQRGATEIALPRSQLDHNPLGPAVKGHLALVTNMGSHRE
jgi:hypothetical protein